MMHRSWVIAAASLLVTSVIANTEKTIFIAPDTVKIPSTHPNLEDLRVDTLTPDKWAIRTHIHAEFPTSSSNFGKPTWLILDELIEGQRYEVRICWAATQPTEFILNTYELPVVFETPELISALSEYSWSRQSDEQVLNETSDVPGSSSNQSIKEREASVLFLQIWAAADYYTANKILMKEVPPVFVDIILDPFIMNVLPRSLIPTVGYITVVTVVSWFLAQRIAMWVRAVAIQPDQSKKNQ